MAKRRPRVTKQMAPLMTHRALQTGVWGWRQAITRWIEWADQLYPEGGRIPDLLRETEATALRVHDEMERVMVKEHGPQPLMAEENKYRRVQTGVDKKGRPVYRRVK